VADIAGLPLRLRGTDQERAGVLHGLFGSLPPTAAEPVGTILYGRRSVAMPRRAPDEAYGDLDVWHEGDQLLLSSPLHGLVARATPDSAVIGGQGAPTEHGMRRLLHPIFTHVLAWHGVYVLHGAAVRKGDTGIFALGQSGQGKSTLVLAAMEHGWDVLADDLVAIRVEDGRVTLRGVPKPLTLPADVEADALDEAETLDWDWRSRRRLAPDRLDLRPVDLAAVVVVSHGAERTASLTPTPSHEITELLFSSFMSTPDAPLLRRFFPVGAAIARHPAWTLGHSTDPDVRLAETAGALDRVVAEVSKA
jgi:hypothetical protein